MNTLSEQSPSNHLRIPLLLTAMLVMVWTTACTSSSRSINPDMTGGKNTGLNNLTGPTMDSQQLAMYRSKLSDLYKTQQNTIPPVFQNDQTTNAGFDDDIGYRIQIISTSRKDSALAVLRRFNDWIFQQPSIEYKAHSYIIFKQPDYRVQVGDFLTQDNAARFGRVLKRLKYPDAWIVRGKINRAYVPADSTIDNSIN